jgi:gas vesicle protein
MDYFRDDSTSTFLMGVATGLALGAIAMFIFDPQQGRRRRALARDKMAHYSREVGDFATRTTKDLQNRAYGLAKDAEGMVREQMGTETGSGTIETR